MTAAGSTHGQVCSHVEGGAEHKRLDLESLTEDESVSRPGQQRRRKGASGRAFCAQVSGLGEQLDA